MKLVPKIVLAGALSVTLVMSGTGDLIISKTRQSMLDTLFGQLSGNVELAVSRTLQEQRRISQIVEVAARNRVIRKALHLYDSRGTSQVLNDLPAIYPFIGYVMVTDPDGSVFAASTRDRDGRKIQGEQLLLELLKESPMLAPPGAKGVAAGIPGNDPFLPILGLKRGLTQWFASQITKRGEAIGWMVIVVDWHTTQSELLKTVVEELVSTGNPITAALLTNAEGQVLVARQTGVSASSKSFDVGQLFSPMSGCCGAVRACRLAIPGVIW